MTLFLTSSPFLPGMDRAVLNPANGFLNRLRDAVSQNGNCLYVCSNPDCYEKTDSYAAETAAAFCEAGIAFSGFAVLDGRNRSEAAQWVAWSDLIILAGGHVPTQNRFFQEIGLAELLKDYPGVMIGISAGSMNCAGTVYAHPELTGEATDPDYHRFLPGLGLTTLNILPHFQQWKGDTLDGLRLFEDIARPDSYGNSFLILVDGSYAFVHDGCTQVFGEAYCLEDGDCRQLSGEDSVFAR